VVRPDSGSLKPALQAVYDDIFSRLAQVGLEWWVPCFRVARLRRDLHSHTAVWHTLSAATEEDFQRYASFELIPGYDPPCPFGLWLLSQRVESLQEAQHCPSIARNLGMCLARWLDSHLWGLPLAEVSSLLDRARKQFCGDIAQVDLPNGADFQGDTRPVLPCAREALLKAAGEAMKNAEKQAFRDTRVQVQTALVSDPTFRRKGFQPAPCLGFQRIVTFQTKQPGYHLRK
jgi:hypothetical protein